MELPRYPDFEVKEPFTELEVKITNILSASEIYVQTFSALAMLKQVERNMAKLGQSPETKFLKHPIQVGTSCIVWDDERETWCRGQIISNQLNQIITTSHSNQNMSTTCTSDLSTFRLIDYGIDKAVSVGENVKLMSRFLRQFPSFACRCSIKMDENTVDENAMTGHLRDIFDGTDGIVTMHPIQHLDSGLEVDLLIEAPKSVRGASEISIKQLLKTISSGQLLNSSDPIRKYHHPREILNPRLKIGTRHRIKVTQLRDVNNFSFVATTLEKNVRDKFDKMTEEMNQFYRENSDRLEMCRVWPLKAGMVVAVNHREEDDVTSQIYRGRIENVKYMDGHVQVFLVDFGLSIKVHWNKIYKLADKFLNVPETAIFCSLKLKCLDEQEPDLSKIRPKFEDLISKDFIMIVDSALTKRHINVLLLDIVTKQNVNDEIDNFFFKTLAVKEELEAGNDELAYLSTTPNEVCDDARKKEDEEDSKLGFKIVRITHCKNPSTIYIRSLKLADAYHSHEKKMREILIKCQSHKNRTINLEKIRPGLSVAVKVKSQVYRGLVISFETESSLVRVKLVDTGRVADVQLDDLSLMPNALRETNQYCICVKLIGIKPAGSSNEWTFSAISKFASLTEGKRLYVKVCGPIIVDSDGEKKAQVRMFEKRNVAPDPFSPVHKVMVDLGEQLVNEGLAIYENAIVEVARSEAEHSEEVDLFSTCGSSVITGQADFIQDFSDEEDELDLTDTQEDWLPPRLPSGNDFEGKITYIDSEGQFYIQPNYQLAEVVGKIITQKYDSMPCSAESMFWEEGDLVIAKYPFGDSGWFRGKVLSVNLRTNPMSLSVLFVDYGEVVELFPWKNECHKDVIFKELPIMCVRCRLSNIVPRNMDGYATAFLNDAHATFVDSVARVKMTSQAVYFPIPVILHAKFGDDSDNLINVAKYFVEKKAAMVTKETDHWLDEKVLEKLEEAGNHIQPVPYTPDPEDAPYGATLTELETSILTVGLENNFRDFFSVSNFTFPFPVKLTATVDMHVFAARPENAPAYSILDDENAMYLDFVQRCQASFGRLNAVICDVAERSKKIIKPTKNHPCLARFSEDELWYRATILEVSASSDSVQVLYVDYGNTEFLKVTEIREIPVTFLMLPKQVIFVEIEELKSSFPSICKTFHNKMQQMRQHWLIKLYDDVPHLMVYQKEVFLTAFEAVSNWKPGSEPDSELGSPELELKPVTESHQ